MKWLVFSLIASLFTLSLSAQAAVCTGKDLDGNVWTITLEGSGKSLKIIDLQDDDVSVIYRDKTCEARWVRRPDSYWTDCYIGSSRLSYFHQHRFPYAIWRGTTLQCTKDIPDEE